jgi:hypothetical protein
MKFCESIEEAKNENIKLEKFKLFALNRGGCTLSV